MVVIAGAAALDGRVTLAKSGVDDPERSKGSRNFRTAASP
jgi:hypothetical protein